MLWIFLTWLSCCPCSLFLLLIIIESPLAYKVAWSSNNSMLAFWEVAIFFMTICNLRWHVLSKDLVHFFWDARLISVKLFIGFSFYCHRISNDHIYLCLIMVAYLIPLAGGLSVLLICFLRCNFWFYWFFLISFQFQFSLVSAFFLNFLPPICCQLILLEKHVVYMIVPHTLVLTFNPGSFLELPWLHLTFWYPVFTFINLCVSLHFPLKLRPVFCLKENI